MSFLEVEVQDIVDEYNKEIERLQRENKELTAKADRLVSRGIEDLRYENEELTARVELLRGALVTVNRILYDDCFAAGMPAKDYIELALGQAPPQSLQAIKAAVEEEVIERLYRMIAEDQFYSNAIISAESIKKYNRKYS